MCDDHQHLLQAASVDTTSHGLTRRGFLRSAGVVAGAGALLSQRSLVGTAVADTVSTDGLTARSMAMHVHSSFSEGMASMDSQLYQASTNGVDVLWWTDHEWKMRARNFKREVHFTALTGERSDGTPAWNWVLKTTGSLTTASTGGISSITSPGDTVSSGSLHVRAQSKSTSLAKYGYTVDSGAPKSIRVNVFGQAWTIDVLPAAISATGYLELLVLLSHHPARGGRPAGQYQLSYRFGGSDAPGARYATGITGVIAVPVAQGQWNTVTLTMSDDIAVLWPDMDPHDFSTFGLTLSAASTGGLADGYFDDMRISRPYTTGDIPLQFQQEIGTGLASTYPGVAQRQGLEVSFSLPHVNWFGGQVTIPTYVSGQGLTWQQFLTSTVAQIHAGGGLASYNHPYGASTPNTVQAQSAQDATLISTAKTLLANQALGVDIIEVGYPRRAGFDLAHHVGLWDVLSRNGLFLTGNGVNDDHPGTDWLGSANNWVTWVWSATDAEVDLLAALHAGRAWTGSLAVPVALDLLVDATAPMGSVSVSSVPSRNLQVFASGLPAGSTVDVLRGSVDYAGASDATPNTVPIASYTTDDLVSGSVSMDVDTTTSSFVRLAVRSASGTTIAISNPVWLLNAPPANGIPAARQY
jgi:hypothetical protein